MKAILLDEAKKWLEENCENQYTRMAVLGIMQSMPTVDYQETPNEPLTLEQLRGMGGQPVRMEDLTGGTLWNQWIIFERHTDDGFIPRGGGYFGCDSYGVKWLAYAYPPAHIGRGIWVNASERMPEDGQIVLVTASGKPQSNITLEYAYELAEWSIEKGWILNCWPEWEGAKVTHWMPLPEPPTELEKRLRG